ncbi:PrnB family protein [Parahaliea mediterranea]|uniref:PrnB family protein n=1 Tax=Parahaliea mediterranea TaxID=651086 RepID=UPI001F4E85A8|nr:monodechloroaminopyrrolnitrin synthase PrnB family protein [Parahaliea mediterranea]
MMTANAAAFDQWIRGAFRDINSELEALYFAQHNRANVAGVGDALKQQLLAEGREHIVALLAEGNTDEGFDANFDLLGNVGFYMAACRRHELTEPSRETRSPLTEASALAMQLGASLGTVPRFASAHLETHNRALGGVFKSFTDLEDELTFIAYNTRGAFGYIRAAEALLHLLPLGISHPVAADLLRQARASLEEVYRYNAELFEALDVERFFYCVRPYYKPHRVGLREYRGANAGDFAGINVIDLLLGLCRADDPYYSQILVDKFLFMRPDDQLVLRDCMRRRSLLDAFLDDSENSAAPWYQHNLRLFLEVCEAHGRTALQHHEQLVEKFIVKPADEGELAQDKGLTASGPPLPVLLKALKTLCDLRAGAERDDIPSRYRDLATLRGLLEAGRD